MYSYLEIISMYWSCAISNLASASQSTFAMSLIASSSFDNFRNFFFCSGVKYAGGLTLSFGATTSAFFLASISAFVRCFFPFMTTKSVGCLCPAMSRELDSGYGADPLAEQRLIRYLRTVGVEADAAVFRESTGRLRVTIDSQYLRPLLNNF